MHERQRGQTAGPGGSSTANPGPRGCACSPCGWRLGKIKLDPGRNQNHGLEFTADARRVFKRNRILQVHSLPAGK